MILFTYEKIDPQFIAEIREEFSMEIIVSDIKKGITPEMSEADIIVGFGPTLNSLTAEVVERFPNLKWLHTLTAGVETIPFEALRRKGVIVSNSRGIHGTQMSEQIIGMMISFTRGLHFNLRNQWQAKWDPSYHFDELAGKTLCIIGAGNIGKELARRAKCFDMHVIGIKNRVEDLPYFDQVRGIDGLLGALAVSDFAACLVPLTPRTFHLIGEKELKQMKPSAIFLNFSRGDVVDEDVLIQALQNRWIRGAGLDVFHQEPLSGESPLWKMDNVLISPHSSGISPSVHQSERQLFKQNLMAYRDGGKMRNVVDLNEKY